MLLPLTNKSNDKGERSWKIDKIQEVDGEVDLLSLDHSQSRSGNPDKSHERRNRDLCLFRFFISKGKQKKSII